jgi:hypothetical protein
VRGFLAGSFALIVLWVAVQPGSAQKAAVGSDALVALVHHALSPQIAGIPQRGAQRPGTATMQPRMPGPPAPRQRPGGPQEK